MARVEAGPLGQIGVRVILEGGLRRLLPAERPAVAMRKLAGIMCSDGHEVNPSSEALTEHASVGR